MKTDLAVLAVIAIAIVPWTSGQDFQCPQARGHYQDPRNQSRFFTCVDYKPTNLVCAEGSVFDPIIRRCNLLTYVNSVTGARCDQGDGMFSVAGDCSQYLVCSNGLPFIMSCPDGLFFNRTHNYCDREVRC